MISSERRQGSNKEDGNGDEDQKVCKAPPVVSSGPVNSGKKLGKGQASDRSAGDQDHVGYWREGWPLCGSVSPGCGGVL